MKKHIALILALVLVLSLFGCKGNSTPSAGATDPSATTEPTHEHDHSGETANTTEGTDATDNATEATEAPTESTTEPTEERTEPSTEAPTEAPEETTEPTEGTTEEATEPTTGEEIPDDPGDIGSGGVPDTPGQTGPTGHQHTYTSKTVAPTCESRGYTEHTCACGHSYQADYKNAIGHSYTTKTVAPTTTEDGYDLHTCGRCGDSYKDNYTPKTGNSGSNDSGDHNGMFYNEADDKWYEWDCATKGHFVREWKVVQEQTCYQYEIKEAKCVVVGCNGVKRQEGNKYGDHIMSSDMLIDYDMRYRVRRYDGYTFYFEDEASARTKASEIATAYKNGTCDYWLEYIAYEQVPVFADEYTCMFCGKTCTTSKGDYDYNGELRDRFVWMERYDRNNQPS